MESISCFEESIYKPNFQLMLTLDFNLFYVVVICTIKSFIYLYKYKIMPVSKASITK